MIGTLRLRHVGRGVATLALVGIAGAVVATYVPRVSESDFRIQVEREIPPGTPREEVVAWLKAKGYVSAEASFSVESDRGGCDGRSSGFYGEFPNYYLDGFFPTVLRFGFHFDEQGRRTQALDVGEFSYCL